MATKKHSVANTLADPTVKSVKVTLKGNDYFLCFDFNALAVVQQQTGLDMLKALDFTGFSVLTYRALLFASLLKFQPSMTLEMAGDLVTMDSLRYITDSILQSYGLAMPQVEAEQEKKDQMGPNTATENSGTSVGVTL